MYLPFSCMYLNKANITLLSQVSNILFQKELNPATMPLELLTERKWHYILTTRIPPKCGTPFYPHLYMLTSDSIMAMTDTLWQRGRRRAVKNRSPVWLVKKLQKRGIKQHPENDSKPQREKKPWNRALHNSPGCRLLKQVPSCEASGVSEDNPQAEILPTIPPGCAWRFNYFSPVSLSG